MQLNGIKRDFDSSFRDVRQDIQTTRTELQRDTKIIRDEVDEFRKSLENVWAAVDDNKEKIALHAQEIASLKSSCATLKDEVNFQRQKKLQLERYTGRENIRLLARRRRQEAAAEGRIDSRACVVNMCVLGEKSCFIQNSVFHSIDF